MYAIRSYYDVDMSKLETLEHEHVAEWYINETEAVVVVKYAREMMEEDALKSALLRA